MDKLRRLAKARRREEGANSTRSSKMEVGETESFGKNVQIGRGGLGQST